MGPMQKIHSRVSIPQAVSTVATNSKKLFLFNKEDLVSIPQAVSTVATATVVVMASATFGVFQYRKR